MIRAIRFLITLPFVATPGVTRSATPVDPQASQEARNVLNWLATLPAQKVNKVVAGQYRQDHIDDIHRETGKWVGLMGSRLINPRGGPWIDDSAAATTRQQMLDHWNAGGIVHVFFQMHNPKTRGRDSDNDFTDADMDAVVAEDGNPINTNFRTWLDRWAVHDQWLAERGVPIIIRPLHEMNCCFWYGRKTPAKTIALWKYIFNYLTKTKGLHNLLFAYTPAEFRANFTVFYPGKEWVDIVGFDLYKDLTGDRQLAAGDFAGYEALKGLGKPIALGEFGPKHATKAPPGSRADYRKLIGGIRSYAPDIVYWFSWSVLHSMRTEDNDHVRELLDDPWVITRDEIPNLK